MTADTSSVLDFPITECGVLSGLARSHGYGRFGEVAEAVRALPYGRVRDLDDIASVLKEQKGTCSSKHRFLAALAHECDHAEVLLTVGLYEMSERNTPGVGAVLKNEDLPSIPGAHCYLMCGGQRFDFTGLAAGAASPFDSLMEERVVSPEGLTATKVTYHRSVIDAWARQRGLNGDRVWAIREQCIALLANNTPHVDARDAAGELNSLAARADGRER